MLDSEADESGCPVIVVVAVVDDDGVVDGDNLEKKEEMLPEAGATGGAGDTEVGGATGGATEEAGAL